MAKTRSKGPVSPKTPLSDKKKKIKAATKEEPSPSARKIKNVKVNKLEKNQEPEPKPSTASASESTQMVSDKVAQGAIKELRKYVDNNDNEKPEKLELFDDEDDKNVYLQINTRKFYSDKPNFKPKVIKLTHPIINIEDETTDFKTCLIIRDQLITTNEQVEAIENENIPSLEQIVSLTTLKQDYKNFEKRRQFYNDYDLFLVDDALLNSMPSLLGKIFYSNGNNKLPLPIRVVSNGNPKQFNVTTFRNQLSKCLSSTSFLPPMGVNISIKFGIINKFTDSQLADNLKDILTHFNKESLRSILLKTSTSPSLPLFYSDKIYQDSDVVGDDSTKSSTTKNNLSAFERGLLELGNPEDVSKIGGRKLNQKLKNQVA